MSPLLAPGFLHHADRDVAIRRRVLFATVSNYAARLVSLGAWVLLTPLMLHRLGPTYYGLWVLVGSLVAYGWLLNAGVQGAITRYVAAYAARGELHQVGRVVTTSLWCDTVLGALAIGLSVLLAPLVPAVFQIPADAQPTATWLVLLMGVGIGLTIPCETGGAVLRGLQRYDLANLVNVGGTLLNVGAIASVLLLGGGLLPVVGVGLPITVLSQVISVRLARQVAPGLRITWRGGDLRLVRTIAGFSWPLLLAQTATLLQRKSDEIVIAVLLPVSFVTPYALAHRLTDMCRDLTKQFMGPFLPLASELDAQHDLARLRSLYINGTRLALAIFLPLACTVTLLARPILRVWVGSEYADNTAIVTILSLAGVLLSTEWLATAVLQGMARHQIQGVVAMGAAVANVAISAALVSPLGITGVALGTLIAACVEYAIVMPYATRVIGVTPGEIVRRILLPTFVPAAAMTGMLYAVTRSAEPESLVSLVAVAALGLGVFAVAYLFVGASRSERQMCAGVAAGTLRLAQGYVRRG